MIFFLLLFVLVPLADFALLIQISRWTDIPTTVLLVIVTGIVGSILARAEGFRTLRIMQQRFAAGEMPTDSVFDAGMILFAAGLLLTPGVITDAFGFLLLIPWFRVLVRAALKYWFKSRFKIVTGPPLGPSQGGPGAEQGFGPGPGFGPGFQGQPFGTSAEELDESKIIDADVPKPPRGDS